MLDANSRAMVMSETYIPLTDLIQPYLNTKLHDIPDEIRNRICAEDTFSLWDFLSPEQRCKWAANIDYEEDPNREDERKRDWDITSATLQTEDEIKRCEGLNTHGIPSEEKIKKAMLAELKNKLAELNEQWNTTLPGLHEAEQKAWKAEHNALSDEEVKARHEVGRYTLDEAAKLIGVNAPISANFILEEMMKSAGTGELKIYKPGRVEPYKPKPIEGAVWVERDCPPPKNQVLTWYVEAFWDDLNNWLKNSPKCVRVEYRFPDPGTLPPAKGEAVRGITKGEVMAAFQDLKWDYYHWGRNLASPPKWLIECRVAKGSRSKKASALWNPVLIAAALFDKKITEKKLDAVFVKLKDWTDEWQEASALFRD